MTLLENKARKHMASKMVRTKPNELQKVIKGLSKGADKALAKLLELVDSEDEKIAFSAAKTWSLSGKFRPARMA